MHTILLYSRKINESFKLVIQGFPNYKGKGRSWDGGLLLVGQNVYLKFSKELPPRPKEPLGFTFIILHQPNKSNKESDVFGWKFETFDGQFIRAKHVFRFLDSTSKNSAHGTWVCVCVSVCQKSFVTNIHRFRRIIPNSSKTPNIFLFRVHIPTLCWSRGMLSFLLRGA